MRSAPVSMNPAWAIRAPVPVDADSNKVRFWTATSGDKGRYADRRPGPDRLRAE